MPNKISEKHIYKISPDHLLPSKVERYKTGSRFIDRASSALFNNADDIVDEVYVDICNGVSRSDIVQKLMKGNYKPQKKEMSYRQSNEYYKTALARMHYNTDIEHARLKDIFYNRYESLLETAVKKGDLFNAKGILDSMSKIFLGDFNKTQNNVQINSMGDGKVVVTFGFGEENKDEDIEDQDVKIIDENKKQMSLK